MELFKIGFLPVRIVDLIDISIVAFLFYKLYDWLRGSLAIRIAIAILVVFLISYAVENLGLVLVDNILDQFIGVGFIAIIVIFAPEIRRFLNLFGRNSFLDRLLRGDPFQADVVKSIEEMMNGIEQMQKDGVGALIVLTGQEQLDRIVETGDMLNSEVSGRLLQSIFNTTSPLHDGAVVISGNRIIAARCVLPITEKTDFPPELGMRHRAAAGLSENSRALIISVSEETHQVSVAHEGELERDVDPMNLERIIREFYDLKS